MIADPSLLDHLLSVMPEEDAKRVHLWAQHPWAVQLLMEDREVPYHYDGGGGRCNSCDQGWTEWDPEHHESDCKFVAALTVLDIRPKLTHVLAAEKRWQEANAISIEAERFAEERAAQSELERLGNEPFADQTTRELREEEQRTDQYGRIAPPAPDPDY